MQKVCVMGEREYFRRKLVKKRKEKRKAAIVEFKILYKPLNYFYSYLIDSNYHIRQLIYSMLYGTVHLMTNS